MTNEGGRDPKAGALRGNSPSSFLSWDHPSGVRAELRLWLGPAAQQMGSQVHTGLVYSGFININWHSTADEAAPELRPVQEGKALEGLCPHVLQFAGMGEVDFRDRLESKSSIPWHSPGNVQMDTDFVEGWEGSAWKALQGSSQE